MLCDMIHVKLNHSGIKTGIFMYNSNNTVVADDLGAESI